MADSLSIGYYVYIFKIVYFAFVIVIININT